MVHGDKLIFAWEWQAQAIFLFAFFSARVVKEAARRNVQNDGQVVVAGETRWQGSDTVTRPPASVRVSAHKIEVRSIARVYYPIQCVWTVLVDLVDSLYCLYDSRDLFSHCLWCKMYLRCVLNDVSRYTAVKWPKFPRKERPSLRKSALGNEWQWKIILTAKHDALRDF